MASSSHEVKRKIAGIGGGTGLTAVWGLENMEECEVTLFEASNRLGGHINSVELVGRKRDGSNMDPVILEGGAEFIGPRDKYVNFHNLCDHLKIEFQEYQLNMDLDDVKRRDSICLPPLAFTSDGNDSGPTGCLSVVGAFFRRGKTQEDIQLKVHTLLCHLDSLLDLNALINKADELDKEDGPPLKRRKTDTYLTDEERKQRLLKIRHRIALAEKMDAAIKKTDVNPESCAQGHLANDKKMITLEQFVNSWINGKASRREFAEKKLYPLIAAGWGVPVSTIRTFGAHYAMQYLRAGSSWFHAKKGLSTYINELHAQCSKTRFELNTPIKRVEQLEVNGQKKYRILKQDDSYDPNLYDELIISTPAYVTKDILAGIQDELIQDLVQKLAAVEYYDTTVAFHQDQRYMSRNRTVVHTRVQEVEARDARGKKITVYTAANTMCKGFLFEEDDLPIMKTWVLPGDAMPRNVLAVKQYRHPVMNQAYKDAQDALHQVQGLTGLWFGGILAGNSDAHESGISVAMEVAAKISDKLGCLAANERLNSVCPNIVKSVRAGTCDLVCDNDEEDVQSLPIFNPTTALSSSGMQ